MSERERDAEQGDARNRIYNRCFRTLILKLVNPLESFEDKFLRAPLVFFLFSNAAQHGLAPFAACSQGRGLSVFMMSLTRNFVVVPYQPFAVGDAILIL